MFPPLELGQACDYGKSEAQNPQGYIIKDEMAFSWPTFCLGIGELMYRKYSYIIAAMLEGSHEETV